MNLLFWNIERLGAGSKQTRVDTFEAVVAELGIWEKIDLYLLCEVSSGLETKNVNRQVIRRRRNPKQDKSQLAYAAFELLEIAEELNEVALQKAEIPSFTETFGQPVSHKGGGNFEKISKRYVAHAGEYEGMQIYVYHANASAKAELLVAWVITHLEEEDKGAFILVGDFNASPLEVKTHMQKNKQDAKPFTFADDGATHNARKPPAVHTYDYAIGGSKVKSLKVGKFNILPALESLFQDKDAAAAALSDHMPIVVQF